MSLTDSRRFDLLVVEDNPADADLLRVLFKDNDVPCRLHVVHDGIEAMDFLQQKGRWAGSPVPHLMLLDLNLPKRSGRELIADVRHHPRLRGLPILVLSTSDDRRDIRDVYELGANGFVSKPIDVDEYLQVVQGIALFWLRVAQLPLP